MNSAVRHPLLCRVCQQPITGEGVTDDAGDTWAHLPCFLRRKGSDAYRPDPEHPTLTEFLEQGTER
jgi:hypothetical protein